MGGLGHPARACQGRRALRGPGRPRAVRVERTPAWRAACRALVRCPLGA